MAQTQISDVVVPAVFTPYIIERSLTSTALFQSGVLIKNGLIADSLAKGATMAAIPFWKDIVDGNDADIVNDDPTILSVPQKFSAGRQIVRKSFLHGSWSEMSLAAELAGSDPITALRDRVSAYWDVQMEKRLISTLNGILASNVANNGGDMVVDISGATGDAAKFNATAMINASATLGDRMNDDIRMIAMHSHIYTQALINDEIQFVANSQGQPFKTYRGLAVLVDDNLTPANGVYTTVLMGSSAIGFGASEPNTGYGTEIYRVPAAGNGGGQTVLHSRQNVAIHPLGFAWSDGTGGTAIAGDSPTIADLSNAAHWTRVATQRKSIPLAFILTK